MVHGLRGRSGRQAMKGLTMQKQEKPETTKASTGIPARVWVVLMLLCVLNVVAGSSPGTGRRSTSTRSVASVPAAGMRTVSSRSPSFSFHRILTTWLPSVLSVASMCRAVIFGSFPMRRVRFFPGHVPAVLTSVDAGRACGPIGVSANQDGGRHGRRGSATSPKNVTDPRRNPDTRFAAEDDGGRGIGAVLAGHDGRRGLCESAMPWLASYV